MNLSELVRQTQKDGLEAVKECLRNYTDINAKDYLGSTALMLAAMESNRFSTEDTVKLLIDAGADVDAKDSGGWTALMEAARSSNYFSTEGTVKLLIDAGADVNATNKPGGTALIYAARYSNNSSTEATVKILIDAGADTTGVLEKAHKDKKKILYECIIECKVVFALGRLDPGSIVSTLPKEICKVILDFVKIN